MIALLPRRYSGASSWRQIYVPVNVMAAGEMGGDMYVEADDAARLHAHVVKGAVDSPRVDGPGIAICETNLNLPVKDTDSSWDVLLLLTEDGRHSHRE